MESASMGGLGELGPLSLGALFLLGFIGSGHCVGMCGPLILAFPGRQGGWGAHLAYNLGRVLTYVLVGCLLGGLGAGLSRYGAEGSLVWTARIQLGFSLLAALLLLIFGLSKLGFIGEPELLSRASPARIPGFRWLKRCFADGAPANLENRRGAAGALFLLGLLLGLLPCGLSFAAFARALAAGGVLEGGLMTLAFGLGTLPSLLLVGGSASRLSVRQRRVSDLVAGMLMIGMAAALVLGGLGRFYTSPPSSMPGRQIRVVG